MSILDLRLLGQRLQRAREGTGLTKAQVATYLNIDEAELFNYEKGESKIPLPVLDQLATLYGHELLYFIKSDFVGTPVIHLDCKNIDLTDEDIKIIGWTKEFLNNLYFLSRLKKSKPSKFSEILQYPNQEPRDYYADLILESIFEDGFEGKEEILKEFRLRLAALPSAMQKFAKDAEEDVSQNKKT